MNNNLNNRIKRLLYRSNNRGCKETDIILGNFASLYIEAFSENELDEYEEILNESDNDIFHWLTGKMQMPERLQANSVLKQLLGFSVSSIYNG